MTPTAPEKIPVLAPEPPEGANGSSWRKTLVKRVIALALLGVTLYLLGPSVLETLSSWPRLRDINPLWFLPVLAAQLASNACLCWLQKLAMRARRWLPVVTAELAGGAISRAVPGGAAAAAALQYTMLTGAGIPAAAVASGLTAASLLTLATVFALPMAALPVILGSTPVPGGLSEAAYIGLGVFGLMLAAGWVVLRTDRPLRAVGRGVQASINRIRRGRPPQSGLPDRLIGERDAIRGVLGRQIFQAIVASLGRWVFDYLSLLAALVAVGAEANPALVLLAFCASQMLATIPITPGGLGFVEAGLTATLALAGVGASQAVLATLIYRLFSYWLPMPAGVMAWWLHRLRYGGRGQAGSLREEASAPGAGPARAAEVQALLLRAGAWARGRPDIRAMALIGSWARGSARSDSDVDLMLLTDDPAAYTEREDWLPGLGADHLLDTQAWGAVTSRRVGLASGLEVEVAVGGPRWAAADPPDPGALRVVRDGCRILHDPDGLLAALVASA